MSTFQRWASSTLAELEAPTGGGPMTDLSLIPTELLQAELAKRKKRRGHPGVLAPCAKCGKTLTVVERRRRCPEH